MNKPGPRMKVHLAAGFVLLAALLAACGKPDAPGEEPTPEPPPPRTAAPAIVAIPEVRIGGTAQPPAAAPASAGTKIPAGSAEGKQVPLKTE